MAAWAIHETKMRVEHVRSGSGLEGWTVTWKGRGWDRSFEDYLAAGEAGGGDDARGSDARGAVRQVPSADAGRAVPRGRVSPHYGPPGRRLGRGYSPLLEKDFSPTLAGDALADERDRILRWLREVPGLIRRSAAPSPVRIALKLMNARHGEPFQVEMVEAAAGADTLVCFNRLWSEARGAAYGGYDLSDRNLRALETARARRVRHPPLSGTGNVSSGRMILEYAKLGCESVQLHTFFQLPLSQYPATAGSRTQRALHALLSSSGERTHRGTARSGGRRRNPSPRRRAPLPRRDGVLMRIARVELYELSLPLVEPFVISGGTMHERRSLVVVLHDEEGHRGYGESPPFELPFYSDETIAERPPPARARADPARARRHGRRPRSGGRSPAAGGARQSLRACRGGDGGLGPRGAPAQPRARGADGRTLNAARRNACPVAWHSGSRWIAHPIRSVAGSRMRWRRATAE